MNSRRISEAEASTEREPVRVKTGLLVCDPIRHGPDELIDAILEFEKSRSRG
jgi:uncharacterized NAD-dependent epimerase/dehydratase family protein